jgi:branched-chain amino acid transport system ATP-binding protein
LETFGSLTVSENLMVGADIRRRWSREKSKPLLVADEILQRIGLGDVADEPIDALPTGLARLCELGRAMASRPYILLLDEPGSGLDATESEDLARLLSELAGEDGLAVLIVEHDMDLVMAVCQHIHVLDFGINIADGTGAEIKANERVQTAYLGSAASRPRRVSRSGALSNGGPK